MDNDIKDYLHYDPKTGIFIWIKKPNKKTYLNSIAGGLDKNGYWSIKFQGKRYLAHRLAWDITYGDLDPDKVIDHINHNRSDNRISNLRQITIAENNRNTTRKQESRIDEAGIWWCRRRKRYIAEITFNHKKVYQKSFTDIDEAINQRKAKLAELGFHENHGEKL